MEMEVLINKQKQLMAEVPHTVRPEVERVRTAGLGVIEEVLEFLNSLGHKPWRPNPLSKENQLEEITDILFYYAELVILSGFTWDEISAEYDHKHAVNLKRYEDAKKGDFSWDKRAQGRGL